MKIIWESEQSKTLHFKDLPLNTTFKIIAPTAKGAVYTKVLLQQKVVDEVFWDADIDHDEQFFQLELQSGLLWKPTESPVELVETTLNISSVKPSIYE
jgi:hypothetical protein